MRRLTACAVTLLLLLVMAPGSPAQDGGPFALYRIGLSDERIFLEADPYVPGRYSLYWSGWITIDARTRTPIKILGECNLTPLGMWTMTPSNRFGTSRLVPGINSVFQKFALASVDLPRDTASSSKAPSMASLFDYTQAVKLKLSVLPREYWVGAPPLARQNYELRPLGYCLLDAASDGDVSLVRELLAKGADVDTATMGNWTALMEAASKGHREVVKLLLDNGAKVNARRRGFPFVITELGARLPHGHTALMAACSAGDPETVRVLLNAGARVNLERSDRWTALMVAAYGGHTEIVRMLLDKGAIANSVDEWGYSAAALSTINGSAGSTRLLKSAGDEIRTPWDILTRQ